MISAGVKLLIGATAIGFAPIFAKLLIVDGSVSPVASGFWRMFIGSLGFLLLLIFGKEWQRSRSEVLRIMSNSFVIVLLAGFLFAADLVAWHTSFLYTSVGVSSIIANFSAVFVPITGIVFFRERLRTNVVYGGLLAFVGFIGLTYLKSKQASTDGALSHQNFIGELLAFLTAFFYTGYILAIKSLATRYSSRVLMLLASSISALILGAVTVVSGPSFIPQGALGWVWALCLGLISQVFGQGLVASSLSVLPAGQSALILLWAPVSSALFGWIFLGEILNSGQIISMIVAVFGIALVVQK